MRGGILALAAAALAGGIAWRRFRPRACPARLAWILDNRVTERLAGAATIVRRLGIEPGMTVLDAGCGPGRVTLPLARAVGPRGRVVALDLQPGMLEKLEARVAAAGTGNVQALQGELGAGRLPAGVFHRAVLVAVLGEVRDRAAALSELHRALRPDGVLSITEALPDPDFQSRGRVRRECARAGFREIASFGGPAAFTLHVTRAGEAAG